MSTLSNWLRLWVGKQVFRKTQVLSRISTDQVRPFTDVPDASSKQQTGTEKEQRVRVRRARPGDVPRVLRFVREHAQAVWPGLAAPPAAPHLMLGDYVARALAQGHSMVAEQQEARRGWNQIRGLALGVAMCPWDAALLEKWAQCVRCARSRRLMHFTAHCLRAPALHDKYRVHNILQVILLVPQDHSKREEIINSLIKNVIKRGKDVGFPLLRFDVTCANTAKTLEDLNLKKEWQLSYDVTLETSKDIETTSDTSSSVKSFTEEKDVKSKNKKDNPYKHQLTVYSAQTENST